MNISFTVVIDVFYAIDNVLRDLYDFLLYSVLSFCVACDITCTAS